MPGSSAGVCEFSAEEMGEEILSSEQELLELYFALSESRANAKNKCCWGFSLDGGFQLNCLFILY